MQQRSLWQRLWHSPRIVRARADTKGFSDWGRNLVISLVPAVVQFGIRRRQGDLDADAVNELLWAVVTFAIAFVCIPIVEFLWNWSAAPHRMAADAVTQLTARLDAIERTNSDVALLKNRQMVLDRIEQDFTKNGQAYLSLSSGDHMQYLHVKGFVGMWDKTVTNFLGMHVGREEMNSFARAKADAPHRALPDDRTDRLETVLMLKGKLDYLETLKNRIAAL